MTEVRFANAKADLLTQQRSAAAHARCPTVPKYVATWWSSRNKPHSMMMVYLSVSGQRGLLATREIRWL